MTEQVALRVGEAPTATVRRTPRPSPADGLLRRSTRAREVALVGVGSLGLAAAMTWPVLRSPTRTVSQDLVDPLYFVWQIAWTGHALGADPASMYTTNAFLHAPGNLAYTDTMLGYAPFAAIVNAVVPGTAGALLTYNLLFVLAAALAFAGAYLLARVLGARPSGALVAAGAYAYAPWHLAHARHLNVLSSGGIVLALALLAYGHGWSLRADRAGVTARRRPGWIVAGWLVACWQLSLGFALGVPFAWALLLVLLGAGISWRRRGRPPLAPGLRAANTAGALAFLVTGVLLALPYLTVVNDFPVAKRTEHMVWTYSPPVRGLFTAPPESWWWGSLHSGLRAGMHAIPEQALLPGFVLFILAMIGLKYSAWALRHRVVLAITVLVTALLAMGTSAPGGGSWTYLVLFRYLPGFSAVRTPGRLVLWCTLALALLAAGAVTRAVEQIARSGRVREVRVGGISPRALSALLLVPAVLVVAEGIGQVAQPVVPSAPVALRTLAGPVLVLPTSQQGDYTVMTWSTDGWPELVNGGSGFEPPIQSMLRRTAQAFPSADSVQRLRAAGVQTVVLDRALAAGTPWATLAADPGSLVAAAGIQVRYQGTAAIYTLSAQAGP
ncbi:MAG TPA: hypothetical protein VLL08_14395 [Kineosporiaceae bacterium]|nr:hypothetical protein [Kineosporiaceae bacterium]